MNSLIVQNAALLNLGFSYTDVFSHHKLAVIFLWTHAPSLLACIVCALSRNPTCSLSVLGTILQPTELPSQGHTLSFLNFPLLQGKCLVFQNLFDKLVKIYESSADMYVLLIVYISSILQPMGLPEKSFVWCITPHHLRIFFKTHMFAKQFNSPIWETASPQRMV